MSIFSNIISATFSQRGSPDAYYMRMLRFSTISESIMAQKTKEQISGMIVF